MEGGLFVGGGIGGGNIFVRPASQSLLPLQEVATDSSVQIKISAMINLYPDRVTESVVVFIAVGL
jgi:hypothetical protein